MQEKIWLITSKKTVVFSVPVEVQSAGEESTTRVSLYRLGNTWRPDVGSQARATGGKQRSLHSSGWFSRKERKTNEYRIMNGKE